MNIHECFPSKFIAAEDLQGQELAVAIERVEMENVSGDDTEDNKPVVYFVGHKKGLVLNKTNAGVIADLYGPETTAWQGQLVTLWPTQTEFKGKTVRCVRIKLDAPAAVQQPVPVHQPLGALQL